MPYVQCKSVHRSAKKSRGAFTFTFCEKNQGHSGDHRGDRKQWRDDGTLVKPITERHPSGRLPPA